MKKVLLVAVATAFVATGFSQSRMIVGKKSLQQTEKVAPSRTVSMKAQHMEKLPVCDVQQQMRTTAQKATRRLISDGIFYSRPAGTLYGGWDWANGGAGYYYTTLVGAPFTDFTFVNKCLDNSLWTVGGEDASEEVVDGNYVSAYVRQPDGASLYYAPTVSTNAGSYTLGDYNVYYLREYTTLGGLIRMDSLTCLYPSDPNAATLYNGVYYSPSQYWGFLDSDNLFGSGADEEFGKATTSVQVFPKPMSPLFFNKIFVEALSETQPIPAGMKMRALITGVKDSTIVYRDETEGIIRVPDMSHIIDVLYAESSDTLDFVSTINRNSKVLKSGVVVYKKPGYEDILGNDIPGNVVIDEEFAVVLADFEKDGVDYGIYGNEVEDGDDSVENGRMFFENGRTATYSGNIALAISLYGMFDKAYAPQFPGLYTFENESLDYSIVALPVEGSPEEYGLGNYTYGSTGSAFVTGEVSDAGYPGAFVHTNVYWFDEEENSNYDILGLPDWIQDCAIDPTFPYCGNVIMFNADPLPTGVEGRYAWVNVVGLEAEMGDEVVYSTVSNPILLVQGNVNVDEVIASNVQSVRSNVRPSNNFTYSLTGQRVANSFKGIVIRDGKKYIMK
jgi:hypothetical protein